MVSAAGPLMAQTAGGGGAPTREEIERERFRPADIPPARLTVEAEVERAPCPLAAPAYENIRFTLSDVVFDKLAGLPAAELRSAWADYVGREVPLATVCEIRDRAATLLRRRGYLAAVQVPPQEIENGIVRFDVLMAKVVSVQVRGDAGRSERTLAGFLEALTQMPVFNEHEAERYLLLVRDLPGYNVRLTLRPAGTAPGEVIGEVDVVHRPFEADLAVQNLGSKEVGRWGAFARAQVNGLTGMGDRTGIGFYTTADFEEQQVLQLFHDFALGHEGLRLAGRFTYAWTRPEDDLGLDLKSRTLLASLEATYPFVRSQAATLIGAVGMDYVNQEIDILGVTTNLDKLRVAYARLDFDSVDKASLGLLPGFSLSEPRWRLAGSVELRQGLDILDATDFCATCAVQPSRFPGDAQATLVRATALGEFRPVPNIAFTLSPRAQYSADPVLAFEEYSAGNYTVGRGYDPGIITGDSGVGFQAELRVGTTIPRAADAFAFQPFAFFDAAWVWNDEDGLRGSEKLYSAGAGLRAAYGERARIDVALAVPLKRTGLQTDRGDARLLISFTTRLAPWDR
jgi:hemolysin activation/secretion protein